ncbi:DNA polymerase III subunit delta' [Maricurvus nonylphenolicus]|uniref:DNA polymerase III subunit delta' n=1 Tax=Maricurvus nonylphenolicus TaxID=1008307 RepID=UPI0036F3C450
MPYPWQLGEWQRLLTQHEQQKLPHALLLAGSRGLGKRQFAVAFGQLLLCAAPQQGRSCGACRSCELNSAQTHPDILLIEPEEAGKAIKIDQIRQVSEFVAKTAQQGGRKVVMVAPAEAMNVNSANALLKSLEEPAGDTTLILVSHTPSQVMPTIRSRCQQLSFPVPPKEQSLQWLANLVTGPVSAETLLDMSAGAPFAALGLLEGDRLEQRQTVEKQLIAVAQGQLSALDAAKNWSSMEVLDIVEWVLLCLHSGAIARAQGQDSDGVIALLGRIEPSIIFRFQDKMLIVKRQLLSGANPNKQLVLEELLLDWNALTKQAASPRQIQKNGLV